MRSAIVAVLFSNSDANIPGDLCCLSRSAQFPGLIRYVRVRFKESSAQLTMGGRRHNGVGVAIELRCSTHAYLRRTQRQVCAKRGSKAVRESSITRQLTPVIHGNSSHEQARQVVTL
jgi:hypothetical protein